MAHRTIQNFLYLCCFLLFVGVASSQEVTAGLLGEVHDAQGALVSGAVVTIINTDEQRTERTTISDAQGQFVATLLPIGHYEVTVKHDGFKELTRSGIELHVGDRGSLELVLSPGAVNETVTVVADASQVQLQTSDSQQLISGTEIRELSLNNRNFLGLLTTLPGVTNTSPSDELTLGASNPTGSVTSLSFSLNGGRVSSNSFLVDGADNLDRGANTTLVNTPSVDAIAEFKLVRGAYSAEYGRNASGQVNLVTKSGDSRFYGDVYEFFRNDVLNGNNALYNYSNIPRPPVRYNNFGYTLGGPVFIPEHYNAARNKTFFFFSEEFRRVIDASTPTTGLAPTNAMKAGTFLHPVCVAYTTSAATKCATTSTQIQPSSFDPTAAEYLKDIYAFLPPGNPTTFNVVTVGKSAFNGRQELLRIDHNLNSNESLTFRYIHEIANSTEPYGYQVSSLVPLTSTTDTQHPGNNAMVRLTSVLRPTLINELAFAYTSGEIHSIPTGLLAKANSPDIQVNLPFTSTVGNVPFVSQTGLSGLKGYGVYDNHSRNLNLFDNVTEVLGRQTLKYGFTYNYYQKTENNASTNAGSFSFSSTTLPSGGAVNAEQTFANFLLGKYATFTQTSLDLKPDIRQQESEFYVQDDFRWSPTLTINAGLRYSLFGAPHDDKDMLSSFDPATFVPGHAPQISSAGTTVVAGTGNPLNGIIVNANSASSPYGANAPYGINSPYGNKVSSQPGGRFAPRVGFAFDPFGTSNTAIRGGYGIVFDSTLVGIYENNIFANRPFLNNLNISSTTFENPAAGTVATSIPTLTATPLPLSLPYTQVWSLDVQQQVGKNFFLDVGYYGAKGTHLLGIVDINTLHPGQAVAAGTMVAGTPLSTSTTPKAVNALRPYVGYLAINNTENWFGSNYNSLQVYAKEMLSHNSMLTLAYTFQKTLTDAGSDRNNAPQDGYNIHQEYAVAPFNRKQVLVLTYVYKVPFLLESRGFVADVVHGWELSGITSFDAGLSTQVTSGSGLDPAGLGVEGTSSKVVLRPDLISNPSIGAPHTFAKWFNTAAYAEVPTGPTAPVRVGDAPATSLIGPGFQQWDASLFRNFVPSKQITGQFRLETFNVFNHTNPQTLNTVTDGTAFGSVTAVREPRRIQLGLKLMF